MQRGNPYHDERGRFTSPYGACRVSNELIEEEAEFFAEQWQEDNSNIVPDGYDYGQPYIRDGMGGYEDYDALMDDERGEKAAEFAPEIRSIYEDYNREMCGQVKAMDYETLKAYADSKCGEFDQDIQNKVSSGREMDDAEGVVEHAADNFCQEYGHLIELRYRRIVAKCNGNRKLFAMAAEESGGYGLNGYASDYATQKIKAQGLMGRYQAWKMTQGTGYSYNMVADSSKKIGSKKYPDGTYNAETLAPLEYERGYQVTYCQIGDTYSEEEHNKLMADFLKHTDDGNVSLGKFEGTPEHSFHFTSRNQAIKFAKKYNQVSIFDWETMDTIETGGTGRRE